MGREEVLDLGDLQGGQARVDLAAQHQVDQPGQVEAHQNGAAMDVSIRKEQLFTQSAHGCETPSWFAQSPLRFWKRAPWRRPWRSWRLASLRKTPGA